VKNKKLETKLDSLLISQLKVLRKKAQAQAGGWANRVLIWKESPSNIVGTPKGVMNLKHRECVVLNAIPDFETGDILVRVATRNIKGDGFINSNDSVHRVFRKLDHWFKVKG
jgi:hypothetical protein